MGDSLKVKMAKELEIFHSFSRACPIPLLSSSARNVNPSRPDVECVLEGEGTIDFELVQIIDHKLMHRMMRAIAYAEALNKGYEAMSPDKKASPVMNLSCIRSFNGP